MFSLGSVSGAGYSRDPNAYQQVLTFHDDDVTGPQSQTPKPEVVCDCPCDCTAHPDPVATGADGGDPGDLAESPSGVLYSSGGINDASAPGVVSTGFGSIAGQSLKWTNLPGFDNGGDFGYGMVDSGLPSIQQTPNGPSGLPGIVVIQGGNQGTWFNQTSSGVYAPTLVALQMLTHNATTGDYTMTDTVGDSITFYGFDGTDASLPLSQQGKLKSYTDVNNHTTTATYSSISGQITTLSRGDANITEQFLYAYFLSGPNAGLVSSVTLQRQPTGVSPTTVRQAVYSYYDGTYSGAQTYGNQGDLQTEQILDANHTVLDTTYFRYYTPADVGTKGYVHGLKYKFSPESYDRMVGAGITPATAIDSLVAPYADDYYEYDSSHRVTLATVQGAGAGTSGQGTYKYSYTTNGTASQDYNVWQTKTIETLPDSVNQAPGSANQVTIYSNFAGEVMLRVVSDNYDPTNSALVGKRWITYDRYDGSGRLVLEAEPSAVTDYNTSYPDLMNFSGGKSLYISDTTGLINLIDYGSSNTATATTAGDVIGYEKDRQIQIGDFGSPVKVSDTQLDFCRNSGLRVGEPPWCNEG